MLPWEASRDRAAWELEWRRTASHGSQLLEVDYSWSAVGIHCVWGYLRRLFGSFVLGLGFVVLVLLSRQCANACSKSNSKD